MNGWDLFTWCAAIFMVAGVTAIFVAFLFDARHVIARAEGEEE